jgi:hypothetical protein
MEGWCFGPCYFFGLEFWFSGMLDIEKGIGFSGISPPLCLFMVGFLCVISFWTSIHKIKRKETLVKGVVSVHLGRGLCIGSVNYLVWFARHKA